MIEIGLYIFAAILLGYLFGWLITKSVLTDRYKSQISNFYTEHNEEMNHVENIKRELMHYKKSNEALINKNTQLDLGYSGQKYVLDEHNEELDEFQNLLKTKDDVIEKLTIELTSVENKQMEMKKKHDNEIDAFLFERIDITQKYKKLLENVQNVEDKSLNKNDPWFSKLFTVPSKS